jgi:hypothetical protein
MSRFLGGRVPDMPFHHVQEWDKLRGAPFLDVKKDGGAEGNGSHDDTSAIQAVYDRAEAAGGAVVLWPAGTYIVDPTVAAVTLCSNIINYALGPVTIKVKSGVGDYYSVFTAIDAHHSRIEWHGFTFDQNYANVSSGSYPAVGGGAKSYFIFSLNASDVVFTDCVFNYMGVNALITASTANERLTFHRCRFNFNQHPYATIPGAGSVRYYDNSAVYSNSRYTVAVDTHFYAPSAGYPSGATGGIELHNADSVVARCTSTNFETLVNVAPYTGFAGNFNATVDDCRAFNCNDGILLWPSGSLKGTKVIHNRCYVKQLSWARFRFSGIGNGSGSTLMEDVEIAENHVECEQEDNTRSVTDPVNGLTLQQYQCGGICLSLNSATARLDVLDNTVVLSPFAGFRLGGEGTAVAHDGLILRNNRLLDCGHYPGAASSLWEAYVRLRGNFDKAVLTGNVFDERFTPIRGRYWIEATLGSYTTACKHGRNEKFGSGLSDNLAANWGAAA